MASHDDRDDDAGWWRESMTLARLRRGAPIGLVSGAALLGGGCVDFSDVKPDAPLVQSADEYDSSMQALALQRAEGWDVGGANQALPLPGASPVDAYGSGGWRVELVDLFRRLQPAQPELYPFYVPTLFQSLVGPGSDRLAEQVSPIHTASMDEDFARGIALRELFEQAGFPADTAIVVDAPGPRSVAIAAALADRFDPVFTFGNWPHPFGVVPAQETLAASLYYLPLFENARPARPKNAPPVFVLDSNRLLPYRDADTQFDNRYLVRLPSAAQLAALGIKHVLYVDSNGQPELDDLNRTMVDLCANGIDVKVAALSDFQRGPAPPQAPLAQGEWPPNYPAVGGDDADDEESPWAFGVDSFWYGGAPEWQIAFWSDYGWYHPGHGIWVGPLGHRHCVTVGAPRAARPHMTFAFHSAPMPRSTLFGGFGAHAAVAPPGFGHVAVRSSRFDGSVTGVRAGGYQPRTMMAHGYGRSGSLGRVGGGMSGG